MNSKGIIADLVLGRGRQPARKLFPPLAAARALRALRRRALRPDEHHLAGRSGIRGIRRRPRPAQGNRHGCSSSSTRTAPPLHAHTATSAPLLRDGWMDHVGLPVPDDALGAIEHQLYAVPFVNLEFAYEDSGAGRPPAPRGYRHLPPPPVEHHHERPVPTFGNTGTYGGRKVPIDPKYLESPGPRQMTVWFDFFSAHAALGTGALLRRGWRPRRSALEGVEYIVYVEKAGPVELLVEKHGYDVAWINPVTGERLKQKGFKGERFTGEPPDKYPRLGAPRLARRPQRGHAALLQVRIAPDHHAGNRAGARQGALRNRAARAGRHPRPPSRSRMRRRSRARRAPRVP